MSKCLICGRDVQEYVKTPDHFTDGTVPMVLERFTRVYRRLCDEDRNPPLQAALLKYILLFGTACSEAIQEGVLPS